jgi:hypothetical protein
MDTTLARPACDGALPGFRQAFRQALLGALVGYLIEQLAAEALQNLGIPPKAARLAGALII